MTNRKLSNFQKFLKHAPKKQVEEFYARQKRARQMKANPEKHDTEFKERLNNLYGPLK